ncbi:hypothetical protein CSAL01_07085 [Colletotrichum salicis]|uniref:Uncharacterized protein n=1 Tax=Colletotrichum salicis TaxID=1209931 RepID=A0A135UBD5_9PEZI|nr:hypothetical protein CSAL01_07085 [Colletotrichum salicis]
MSANGGSAHGLELPSASASTLMTAAAIANFSKNHGQQPQLSSRKDRDKLLLLDERAPGGAAGVGLGGRSSLDMTRSEYVTPSRSPDSSRRTSALVGPMIGGGENPATAVTPPSRRLRKVNNAAALVEEKGRTANRVAGLKNSLVELSGFSTATTRRLDETYYSVLEKKSMLQNTISAIRELTVASRQMTGEFVSEADEMVRDVAGQLDTFGQFGEQESRIKQLQGRIESGRTRIEGLSGRVDLVRRRIEGWERADREWQEKTRKRLRAVWIVTSVVFAVLLLLFVGAQYLGGPADLEGAAGRALKGLERGPNRSVEGVVGSGEEGAPKLSPLWEDRRGREEEEDRLRVFDEL